MNNFFALKIADNAEEMEGRSIDISHSMIVNAPSFETEKEANEYTDLINPDAVWVIGPLNDYDE